MNQETTHRAALPRQTRHDITVLLIDDQAMVGEAVRRMLEAEKDIIFHFCQDPTKAIQTANEIHPTVILQDLVMPDIDGLTLAKFFRANPATKETPLIVLSTREEATTKAEAFGLGASDYLVKLPDRIELIARIRHHSRGYINLLERNEAFRALADQLQHASEYVVSLLPEPIGEGPVRTNWKFVPSAQLGGDSLGYHWIDDDHFAVYLLDVCDHGVGPALLSVQALNALRAEALPGVDFLDPSSVLAGLNDTFQMEKHNDLYFTIWYGVYNKKTRELTYATGGHPPAIVVTNDGNALECATKGMLIGAMPGMEFVSEKLVLQGPATLYTYSDGVYEVETPQGKMWTFEEFKDYLLASRTSGTGQHDELQGLYDHVMSMHKADTLEDDFSILRVEFS
jgi:sigma-B regulation protein RsbU (phosphoserine phosphatase)